MWRYNKQQQGWKNVWMPPTLDTTLLDLHRWNIYTVYSRLVVARSRGSRHFPTKINSMRLGQHFPVISHVTFPCVLQRVPLWFHCRPWVPGFLEEMLKPKLHSALSMVAPVDINPCLLGDTAPQMDEARLWKSPGGWPDFSLWKCFLNQHSMGKRKKMMDICIYIYIYICDIWVCLEIEWIALKEQ